MSTQSTVNVDLREIARQLFEINVDTGRATSGAATTLTDTTKIWVVNAWANYAVEIVQGTGTGQFKKILSNTADTLTVDGNWTTIPDATSRYRITPFGIIAGLVTIQSMCRLASNDDPIGQVTLLSGDEHTAKVGVEGLDTTTSTPVYRTVGVVTPGEVIDSLVPINVMEVISIPYGFNSATGKYDRLMVDANQNLKVVTQSNDNPIGKVTVQSICRLASNDDPIGQVTILSGDIAIGDVHITSMAFLASGDEHIGQVTISSGSIVITSGNIEFNLLSGDQPIGQVTIQSMCRLASNDDPIGQITILSGDQPIGQVTIQSMPAFASSGEPIGLVVVTSTPALLSGDQPIGQVTIQSMARLASNDDPIGQVTILSGDQPIGQVTIQSMPAIASGDEHIGQVTISSGQVVITSGNIEFNLLSGDQPIGQVTIQSMPAFASSGEPIGLVVITSTPALLSGDNPIGQVTVRSMPFLASGGQPIGTVAVVPSITSMGVGRIVVDSAGTAITLTSGVSKACKKVTVMAETDNTGYVVVGDSSVVAALGTRRGVPLNAGDSYEFEIDDLVKVYLDAINPGDGVTYTFFN